MEKITIGNWTTTGMDHPLSPRELEATMYALADLSVKQIAREMHIEAGTVQRRLDKARWKLGFKRTMRGLCAEIIHRGIIVPHKTSTTALPDLHSAVRDRGLFTRSTRRRRARSSVKEFRHA